jgi:general secretion pathway protein G
MRRSNSGFTLIEIMMVVVIIGILAALIIPNVVGRDDQARATAVRNDIRSVANALDMYKMDNTQYPSTDQGLDALVNKPSGSPEPKNYPPDPYLKKVPVDPWGKPLVYINDGNKFDLYSLGSDGKEGGEGYAADVHYSDL